LAYAAATRDEAQRSIRAFYEAVKFVLTPYSGLYIFNGIKKGISSCTGTGLISPVRCETGLNFF
jgi:hypothetical protein